MLQEIDQLPRWRYGLDVSLAGVLNEGPLLRISALPLCLVDVVTSW